MAPDAYLDASVAIAKEEERLGMCRTGEEKVFEVIKGLLLGRSPVPREVFLGEVNEGAGEGGVIRDESPVEVGKA